MVVRTRTPPLGIRLNFSGFHEIKMKRKVKSQFMHDYLFTRIVQHKLKMYINIFIRINYACLSTFMKNMIHMYNSMKYKTLKLSLSFTNDLKA